MLTNVHFLSLVSSSFVGLIGLLPLIVFYSGFRKLQSRLEEPIIVSRLLSFAVGCLLGDIFFHLLPESWSDYDKYSLKLESHVTESGGGWGQVRPESWVLGGFVTFFVVEKLFSSYLQADRLGTADSPETADSKSDHVDPGASRFMGKIGMFFTNYFRTLTVSDLKACDKDVYYLPATPLIPCVYSTTSQKKKIDGKKLAKFTEELTRSEQQIKREMPLITHSNQTTGYMNLIANFMDNFTHGLAISASYSSRTKMGFLTTCAIFLHEIPHEFGDFAILLKSGFNTWSAIKAQLFTSIGCVLGAGFGMLPTLSPGISGGGGSSYRILSFTSGGFLHIVLVKIIPDLINQNLPFKETLIHVCGVGSGLAFMYAVSGLE